MTKPMAPVQRKGLKALQLWCQRVTAGYPHVNVTDLGASFRDGLAFNAIIHHFRPHLFDFDSLDPADVRENNAHAFHIAERELDIPALLDPEDMVDCEEPDKFSVSTYLAQFYHLFKNETSSPVPSPRANLTRLSSSESENDSLLAGGSEASSPASGPSSKSFDRSDLVAKYGEDIFSSAKKDVAATPRASSRAKSQTPTNLLTLYGDDRRPSPFNRAELVAKYGEDIFSSSKHEAKNSEEEPEVESKFLRGKRVVGVRKSDSSRQSPKAVANVCKQFEIKANISAS